MSEYKSGPKGLIEAIRRAVDLGEGVAKEFPGGVMTYENSDDILDLWYKKVWRVGDVNIELEATISVKNREFIQS